MTTEQIPDLDPIWTQLSELGGMVAAMCEYELPEAKAMCEDCKEAAGTEETKTLSDLRQDILRVLRVCVRHLEAKENR